MKDFSLPFQFVCPLYKFFDLLDLLVLLVQWRIEVVKARVKTFSLFPVSMTLPFFFFLVDALYTVEKISFYSYFAENFMINQC